jgi:hypothetical protein
MFGAAAMSRDRRVYCCCGAIALSLFRSLRLALVADEIVPLLHTMEE